MAFERLLEGGQPDGSDDGPRPALRQLRGETPGTVELPALFAAAEERFQLLSSYMQAVRLDHAMGRNREI